MRPTLPSRCVPTNEALSTRAVARLLGKAAQSGPRARPAPAGPATVQGGTVQGGTVVQGSGAKGVVLPAGFQLRRPPPTAGPALSLDLPVPDAALPLSVAVAKRTAKAKAAMPALSAVLQPHARVAEPLPVFGEEPAAPIEPDAPSGPTDSFGRPREPHAHTAAVHLMLEHRSAHFTALSTAAALGDWAEALALCSSVLRAAEGVPLGEEHELRVLNMLAVAAVACERDVTSAPDTAEDDDNDDEGSVPGGALGIGHVVECLQERFLPALAAVADGAPPEPRAAVFGRRFDIVADIAATAREAGRQDSVLDLDAALWHKGDDGEGRAPGEALVPPARRRWHDEVLAVHDTRDDWEAALSVLRERDGALGSSAVATVTEMLHRAGRPEVARELLATSAVSRDAKRELSAAYSQLIDVWGESSSAQRLRDGARGDEAGALPMPWSTAGPKEDIGY